MHQIWYSTKSTYAARHCEDESRLTAGISVLLMVLIVLVWCEWGICSSLHPVLCASLQRSDNYSYSSCRCVRGRPSQRVRHTVSYSNPPRPPHEEKETARTAGLPLDLLGGVQPALQHRNTESQSNSCTEHSILSSVLKHMTTLSQTSLSRCIHIHLNLTVDSDALWLHFNPFFIHSLLVALSQFNFKFIYTMSVTICTLKCFGWGSGILH